MDQNQLIAFCDYAIGDRIVGGNDPGDPVGTPHSPEVRAFVIARIGAIGNSGYQLVTLRTNKAYPHVAEQARAFAALLREVADGIDPPETNDAK
jgi:hypothetical protein